MPQNTVEKPTSAPVRVSASSPVVPSTAEEFTPTFAKFILEDWFKRNDQDPEGVEIRTAKGRKNEQQGLLSTTFILDISYSYQDENLEKSVFVKIPLKGEAGAGYKQVNVRENEMYQRVLPGLQKYLSENCEGFFCLGVPEIIYTNYEEDELHDVVVLENLVAAGFETCVTQDLSIEKNGKDYLRACLETLAQLHGTGLCYKNSIGGNAGVLKTFPNIEEQVQVKDILSKEEERMFLRKHFSAFIRYLEESDVELKGITQYMRKMDSYLFKILQVLDQSGVSNLNTLCHGDAKPNNFMFRKICLEFEDEGMSELDCQGVEAMLIDWQGGFLGSLCNDLMWCIYPFLEVNNQNTELYNFAFQHYQQELQNVLQTFGTSLAELNLPESPAEFRSLIRRGFVLEFMIVTVLRPVMNITKPDKVSRWYEKLVKYERRKEKGGIHKYLAGKPPKLPSQEEVFQNPRYMEFLQFYFKIATSLGAFQEMGLIYFELMKDSMFGEGKLDGFEGDVAKKVKPFSGEWLKRTLFGCTNSQNPDTDVYTKKDEEETGNNIKEETEVALCIGADIVYADEDETKPRVKIETGQGQELQKKDTEEEIYEDVKHSPDTELPQVAQPPKEPTPDPLRTLAAELHASFLDYKTSYSGLKGILDNLEPTEENTEDSVLREEQEDILTEIKPQVKPNSTSSRPSGSRSQPVSTPTIPGVDEDRINLNTPLTLRKISKDVDFSNRRVQEAVSFLSSDCPTEPSQEQRFKISRQASTETRKDSFCSNLSKQELMDILDEDEAAWDESEKFTALSTGPIPEKENLSLISSYSVPSQSRQSAELPTTSDDKKSILAWLSLSPGAETAESTDYVPLDFDDDMINDIFKQNTENELNVPKNLSQINLQPVILEPADLKPVVLQPLDLELIDLQPDDLQPVALQPADLQPVALQPADLQNNNVQSDELQCVVNQQTAEPQNTNSILDWLSLSKQISESKPGNGNELANSEPSNNLCSTKKDLIVNEKEEVESVQENDKNIRIENKTSSDVITIDTSEQIPYKNINETAEDTKIPETTDSAQENDIFETKTASVTNASDFEKTGVTSESASGEPVNDSIQQNNEKKKVEDLSRLQDNVDHVDIIVCNDEKIVAESKNDSDKNQENITQTPTILINLEVEPETLPAFELKELENISCIGSMASQIATDIIYRSLRKSAKKAKSYQENIAMDSNHVNENGNSEKEEKIEIIKNETAVCNGVHETKDNKIESKTTNQILEEVTDNIKHMPTADDASSMNTKDVKAGIVDQMENEEDEGKKKKQENMLNLIRSRLTEEAQLIKPSRDESEVQTTISTQKMGQEIDDLKDILPNLKIKRTITIAANLTPDLTQTQTVTTEDEDMPSLVDSQVDKNENNSKLQVSETLVHRENCDQVVEIFDFIAENIDQSDMSSVVRRFGARETKVSENLELHTSMKNLNSRLSYLELENGDGLQNNVLLSGADLQDNLNVIKGEGLEKYSPSHSEINPEKALTAQEESDIEQAIKDQPEKNQFSEKLISNPFSQVFEQDSPRSKTSSPETEEDESPEQDDEPEPSSRSGNSTLKKRRNSQKKKRRKSKLYF